MSIIIETIENYGRALRVQELADLVGISKQTIYRRIRKRKLPSFRIVEQVRLDPKITAEWLRARFG